MATEHLREKMNQLTNLILNEDVQVFTQQLQIEAAQRITGDNGVDQQLQAAASNARATVLAAQRRLEVYRLALAKLNDELAAQQAAAEAAEKAKNAIPTDTPAATV